MAIDLRYWDSACFLAVLLGEEQATECDGVIQAAEDRRVSIVTSTWTLTEVIRLSGHDALSKDEDATIRLFFERSYIILRPVTEDIAHSARVLVWAKGYSQKDAIHVATALDAACPVLDTFDNPLINNGGPPGLRITRPDLPAVQALFPD
jgi:predicted nucleic acid-binding protein